MVGCISCTCIGHNEVNKTKKKEEEGKERKSKMAITVIMYHGYKHMH